MSTVYVVTAGCYSDYRIEGVFSTREGADRFAAEFGDDANPIEEFEVDGRAAESRQTIYWVRVDLDGSAGGDRATHEVTTARYTKVDQCGWGTDRSPVCWWGQSAVSRDHALKLAIEARQAWLRNNAVAVVRGHPDTP
jgi:hypothetical protein